MRRTILPIFLYVTVLTPVHAQVFEHVEPQLELASFAERLAAERSSAVGVTEASRTDFTVSGYAYEEVDLPYPLTVGAWTATLTITGDYSYTIYLHSKGDRLPLFCQLLICGSFDHPSRKQFYVNSEGNAYVDPITSTGNWTVRFVKDSPAPPPDPEPPVDDTPPCNAAGSGINLNGHQVFMCIVASGEVHQLSAEQLSSKVAVFGRRSDPKAVVKLVGGCTWGAIAAVTTARRLQIRVYNTANGKEWEHNHNSSGLAPSGYSGSALCD